MIGKSTGNLEKLWIQFVLITMIRLGFYLPNHQVINDLVDLVAFSKIELYFFFQSAKSFDDILEITSIEDEGEVLDGEDHILLQKFNEKLELKTFFELWKDAVQLSATKRRKAEFYNRFTTMERSFKSWKNVVKELQKKREEDKWFKAIAFDETRLVRYNQYLILKLNTEAIEHQVRKLLVKF